MAVIALGGIPNKAQVGDMGIDGRIYPVSAIPQKGGAAAGELDFLDVWYPIQVKQKDPLGRPDSLGRYVNCGELPSTRRAEPGRWPRP